MATVLFYREIKKKRGKKYADVSRETSVSFWNNDLDFQEFTHVILREFCVFLNGFDLIKGFFQGIQINLIADIIHMAAIFFSFIPADQNVIDQFFRLLDILMIMYDTLQHTFPI